VERGKPEYPEYPEYPEKPISEQRREPTTNSTDIRRRLQELIPGHTDGRRVLSPLGHGRLRYKMNIQVPTGPDWCTECMAEIFVLTTSENTPWWNSLTTELLCVAFWSSFTTEYC